jgi:hypothetical protein
VTVDGRVTVGPCVSRGARRAYKKSTAAGSVSCSCFAL